MPNDAVNNTLGPSMPLLDPHAVGKDILNSNALWRAGYDPIPNYILNSPVKWRIFNCGPIGRTFNPAGHGVRTLKAAKFDKDWNLIELQEPYEIRETVADWADQGDYKHKFVPLDGDEVMRETMCPGGEQQNDLRRFGIIATRHEKPTKEELAEARKNLETYFGELVKKADKLFERNRPGQVGVELGDREQIVEIFRVAARFLNVNRPWMQQVTREESCPGCGVPVPQAVAKCPNAGCGAILDWEKAYTLGIISKTAYHDAIEEGRVPGKKPATKAAKQPSEV